MAMLRPVEHFALDPVEFKSCYDREPFGFTHDLASLPIFSEGSLIDLAAKYGERPGDAYVSSSAATADSEFFSLTRRRLSAAEAMQRLDGGDVRILLKRPENYDPRFRTLLDELFAQIVRQRGDVGRETVLRLEAGIFITSASATTPFHFDPEINFFSQVVGTKVYHVYSPEVVSEAELEHFYLQGAINIGQVPLANRDPRHEHVFMLQPGKGLHQPQNAPHWVETRADRSVSYAFVYETDRTRAIGRARAANHYLRKAGLKPSRPGSRPVVDYLKSSCMHALIPVRQRASRLLKRVRHA